MYPFCEIQVSKWNLKIINVFFEKGRKKLKGSPHILETEQGQGLINAATASWITREEAGIGRPLPSRSFVNMLTRLPLPYSIE